MPADELHRDLGRIRTRLLAHSSVDSSDSPRILSAGAASGFELDSQQSEAARQFHGPVRVLAPAGSGKTRTLTARIHALIAGGVRADSILALAFNAKAAQELEGRLLGTPGRRVQTRTFHSLGYEIVREVFGWRYRPENEARFSALAEGVIASGIALPEHEGQARRMLAAGVEDVSAAKAGLTPLGDLRIFDGETLHPFGDIFLEILARQQQEQLLTFADMVYFALRALVASEGLRNRWQARFPFILVDEFQDLNAAQMLFLQILALPQDNLFVVGDDDQLIYAWRGARVAHILDYDEYYPAARSVVLETNYRSDRRLVRHSRWLIENNSRRVAKNIRARAGAPAGRIDIILGESLEAQAAAVAGWLRSTARETHLNGDSFGLLYRTNREARWLEEALRSDGIPFSAAQEPDPGAGDSAPDVVPGRVTLLTVHKAKGVEFPYVVYFNLSRRGAGRGNEADERRVAYVGVTRAQHGLLVTADLGRPSRFLLEFALNPNFRDLTEPYLERRLRMARLRMLWVQRRWRDWFALLFRPSSRPNTVTTHGYAQDCYDETIDRLETELRLRRALGVSFQVIPKKRDRSTQSAAASPL